MATKKYIELKEFADEQLANELNETKVLYNKLKFDHAMKGLDNPLRIRAARRDIARMNSELRRRELAGMAPEQVAKRSKIRKRK